jgi:hypothetical protein
MHAFVIRAATAGLLLGAVIAAPAAAANRIQIVIDINNATGTESFVATGGFCATGSAVSHDFRSTGRGENHAFTFHLQKTLTCADGSGTLTIAVNAATTDGAPNDQGGWSVVSGTGAWTAASGGGSVVGTYVATGIIDRYVGVLQV